MVGTEVAECCVELSCELFACQFREISKTNMNEFLPDRDKFVTGLGYLPWWVGSERLK